MSLAIPAIVVVLTCLNLRADVGIVVYESKGVDARRTGTGHVALVATDLCAEGIDEVRKCEQGEKPGVSITRYANLAHGYDRTLFVVPLTDHFAGTSESRLTPALSSGGTLDAMQIQYWRDHLRPNLAPLTESRFLELKTDLERFEMGRTFRKLISLELLIGLLGPHKKKSPADPIALVDPLTSELIPNGRWREAIGAAHTRTSMIVARPVKAEREERLIAFVKAANTEPFQAMTSNCSDFVERGLLKVFRDDGLRFRPRIAKVADAWITSPLEVATAFLNLGNRHDVPLTVTLVPMLAGTRRPTAGITSIGRGALVPSTSNGKMAFGMKVYFNT